MEKAFQAKRKAFQPVPGRGVAGTKLSLVGCACRHVGCLEKRVGKTAEMMGKGLEPDIEVLICHSNALSCR